MSEFKKVLLIGAKFPPEGGGGVIRACKMAKYLGDYGYKVYVLTREPSQKAIIDESLLSDIPSSVRILRSKWPFFDARLPLRYLRWAVDSFPIGVKLIIEEGIDVLWSTSPPPPSHILGYWLKRATQIPWIADFRDPWTQHMLTDIPSWRKYLEKKLERCVLGSADIVTTVTPSFLEDFQTEAGDVIQRIELIYNGFDPNDYVNIRKLPDDNKFTMAYAGILYPERSPRVLLESIAELIAEGSVDREKIILRFAGQFDLSGCEHRNLVEALHLSDVVELLGPLPHKEALTVLKSANVLLIIGDALPGAEKYIPGKLYEYMAIEHPILALQVKGEAQRIIDNFHLGKAVDPLNKEAIKRSYLRFYQDWEMNKLSQKTDPVDVNIFDRRIQAYQLSQLMNELVAT
jgi:glycosyltransferase involved in cell wall biosynthesis